MWMATGPPPPWLARWVPGDLVIATNVPGLLRDPHDQGTLIRHIEAARLEDYSSYAQGRMRKKMLGAKEAITGGVSRVHIGNAPLSELLNGAGTTIAAVSALVAVGGRE